MALVLLRPLFGNHGPLKIVSIIHHSFLTVFQASPRFWILPMWEQLHGFDMEPLSGSDVLAVCKRHRSLHGAGKALIQPGAARCCHQLQPGADHMAHNYREKHTNKQTKKNTGLFVVGVLQPNRTVQIKKHMHIESSAFGL